MRKLNPVHSFKAILILILVITLSACATPNIKPFAEQTVNLAGAISTEQNKVSAKFEELIEISGKQSFVDQKEQFDESSKALSVLLEQIVIYSEQLVLLAEAGETGEAAANSLLDSAGQFGSMAGLPGAGISGTIVDIFAKVSQAATRIQAQNSLEDATREAQPAVNQVAVAVKAIYENVQKKLVTTLKSDEIALIEDKVGVNVLGLYRDVNRYREEYFAFVRLQIQTRSPGEGFCTNSDGSPDPSCFAAHEIQTIAALNEIMLTAEPLYLNYQKEKAKIIKWRLTRLQRANLIVRAVKAWSAEHEKIATVLENCSGFKSYKCQEFSAGNLKSLISQLKDSF